MLFSIIALEKFAQKSENKATIKRKLAMFSENPLIRLERHVNSTDYTLRQVGYCARWCLDNYCKSCNYQPYIHNNPLIQTHWAPTPIVRILYYLFTANSSYYRWSKIFVRNGRCIQCKCNAEYTWCIWVFENIARGFGDPKWRIPVWKRSLYVSSEYGLLVLWSKSSAIEIPFITSSILKMILMRDHELFINFPLGYNSDTRCNANRLGYQRFQFLEPCELITFECSQFCSVVVVVNIEC